MRFYYRFVLWTVAGTLLIHGALRFLLHARSQVGPLVLALDGVLFVLAFLGIELEPRTGDRQGRSARGPILTTMGLLLVVLCFETGGAASPFFLLVVLAAVFGALTMSGMKALFLTAILGTSYSFCSWVSPSEGLLHGGMERIQEALVKGRTMSLDQATSLLLHCGFLFAAAWIATRLSTGYRQQVTHFQEQATRDPLTSLPNRRAFVEKVRQELDRADRYRWPVAILIVDLDHFKMVNDVHGHAFGDAVLGQSAQLLREAVGTIDHLARIGGEEFAVAAVGADPNHGAALAQQVLRRFRSHPWERMKAGLKVTCSIGVAVLHPRDNQSMGGADQKLSFLLDQADKALYHVKGNGRDNYAVHGMPGTPSKSPARASPTT
jgi:diguanylate cyclase (GGDEF)-like protein